MMYLRRLRLVRLGPTGSDGVRFDPVELSFVDEDDRPCHTGLLLENGGGKTTLISWLFASLDPTPSRFIATKRTSSHKMADYVTPGTVAHVICEWAVPLGQPTLTGEAYQTKVTGLVMAGKGPSILPDRRVYGFRSNEALNFDSLPHGGGEPSYLTMTEYMASVRSLAEPDNNLYDDTATTDKWQRWLRGERIDPDLIAMQATMNAQESGAASLLTENADSWSFTEHILRLTADATTTSTVDALAALHTKAQRTASRRQELVAFEAVTDPLTDAGIILDDLASARTALRTEVLNASRLVSQLTAAAEQLTTLAGAHEADEREAERRRVDAETARLAWSRRHAWAEKTRLKYVADRLNRANEAAEDVATAAQRHHRAWDHVEHAIDLRAARQDQTRIQALIDDAHAAAKPYQDALRERISTAVATVDHLVTSNRAEARTATGNATQAEKRAQTITDELAALVRREATAEQIIEERTAAISQVNLDVQERVDAGDLPSGDVASYRTALLADRQAALDAEQQLRHDRDAVTATLKDLRAELDTTTQSRTKAESARDNARDGLAQIAKQITAVAELDGFHDITDVDTVLGDLDHVINVAKNRDTDVRDRHETVDDTLTQLRRDRSLLDGRVSVDTDVSAAVDALKRERITAFPGWEHIADAAPEERTALVTSHPDVANGVVVVGTDPGVAASKLHDVTVDRAIVIAGPPTSADAGHQTVLLPPAHRYDPDVAAARKADLDKQIKQAEEDVDALAVAISRWTQLGARLVGLRGLDSRRSTLLDTEQTATDQLARASDDIRRLSGQIDREDKALDLIGEKLTEAAATYRELTTTLEWVAPLAERVEAIAGLREQIGAAQADLRDVNAARDPLFVEQQTLAATIDQLKKRAIELTTAADRLRSEARGHRIDLDGDHQPISITGDSIVPLERLYTDIDQLRDKVRDESPDDTLHDELDNAARAAADAAERLELLDDAERSEVDQLIARPEAHDAYSRRRAVADAAARLMRANRAAGEAGGALREAEREHRNAPSGEPPSERYPLRIPTSEDDATAIVEDVAARVATEISAAAAATTARDTAKTKREECEARANAFSGAAREIANSLQDRGLEPADQHSPEAIYVGSAEDASNDATQTRQKLAAATKTLDETEDEANRIRETVATIVDTHDGFPGNLADQIRLAVTVSHADVLRVATEVETRIARLKADLASFDSERDHMVAEIGTATASVLNLLDKLARTSTMRGNLGDWTGKKFISVTYQSEVKKDLATPTRRVIEEVLESDASPDRLEMLLVRILKVALGDNGLRIRMLKPTSELSYVYNDISAFSASEGQQLTAAILLYCVLSRIRSDAIATTGHGPGALWLDNPFGKANQTTLVDLQRRMADALNVQLIYCTGIADANAVAHLDRWTHLVPKLNRASGDRHLTVASVGRTLPQIAAFHDYQQASPTEPDGAPETG